MARNLTDEDYDRLGGRLAGASEPGMQPLTEEGVAALEQAPPEPAQDELVEAAVAGYVPPETGPVPKWAQEWGYLPQKPWDKSYYDIPIARLMDFPGSKGGRVHTVHEGDYVEGLGTVSTISMDPNGFHVSVEIVPDDENEKPFWIGGEPKDPGNVFEALNNDDLGLLEELLDNMLESPFVRDSTERALRALRTHPTKPMYLDSKNQPLYPGRVAQEFSDAVATQHLIYGTDDDGLLGSMTQADLIVMTGDADVASTTSHEIDGTEWTRHDISGRDGVNRVFYEDPETGRVGNASIPANAEEGPAERPPSTSF